MVLTKTDLDLLIQALDFWIQDSVLPAFPRRKEIGRKGHWNTKYLCMTKQWKHSYSFNRSKAICELIINHYGYIIVKDNTETVLTNNKEYLYKWFTNKNVNHTNPLIKRCVNYL